MIARIFRELRARLAFIRDPIGYHRARGVRIGQNVELIGGHIHSFGSEPYLVTVGNRVTISHGVDIITHDGGLRVIRDQHPDAYLYRPITICDGAFIGARAIILPGVTIGEGAVIGAGSVVSQDVPPGTVAAGVPARPIKPVSDYAFAHRAEWIKTTGLSEREKRDAIQARRHAQTGNANGGGPERYRLPWPGKS